MSDMFEITNEAVANLVMLATHVLEMERNHLTDGAIIVKLLVENFVLNCKLMGMK
jgi:hypothetical protein